jgi:hypothetical protein
MHWPLLIFIGIVIRKGSILNTLRVVLAAIRVEVVVMIVEPTFIRALEFDTHSDRRDPGLDERRLRDWAPRAAVSRLSKLPF